MWALSVGVAGRESEASNAIGSNEVPNHSNLVVVGPEIDDLTGELRAIVCKQSFWCTPEANKTVQNFSDVLSAQAMSHLDSQAFAREDVDHGEKADFWTAGHWS